MRLRGVKNLNCSIGSWVRRVPKTLDVLQAPDTLDTLHRLAIPWILELELQLEAIIDLSTFW